MTCPLCEGNRRNTILVRVQKDGRTSCEERVADCHYCRGSGEITEEHQERIEEGARRRADRLARGLSGKEEAARLGIDPVTLNHIEHGRKE